MPDGPTLISLNKWEILAVEVISRARAPRIILESRSDGNYELAQVVDAWRSASVRVSSLPVVLKVNLDSQRCRVCFVWTWLTTSDYKSNQAGMTHSRHKGSSWVSWRVYANVNGDYVAVGGQLECIKPCLSFKTCESTKLQERQHLLRLIFCGAQLDTLNRKSSAPLRSNHPGGGETNLLIVYTSSGKPANASVRIRQSEQPLIVFRGTVLWGQRCVHFTHGSHRQTKQSVWINTAAGGTRRWADRWGQWRQSALPQTA